MSAALASLATHWHAAGRSVVIVEVTGTRGSVPREAGTRMLVSADDTAATIGGGHLELEAISIARSMLVRGERNRCMRAFPLGPALGQCCGGTVELSFTPLDEGRLAEWPAPSPPLFRLQLHGAGHVGRAIATLLATIDCEVDWFDQRDDGFPQSTTLGSPWPEHIRRTAVDTVEAEVSGAAAGAFFLVLTHEHAIDLRIVEAVLRRGDFGYLGLIGSKTKRASFAHRLEARGFAADAIDRIVCPIGVDGIDGKAPEVLAVAAVAELLQRAEQAARPDASTASRMVPMSP